jgi:hypothetical protein
MTTTQNTPTTLRDAGFHYDEFVGDCGGWARRGTVGGVVVDDLIFREGKPESDDNGDHEPMDDRWGYFWTRVRLDDGAEIEGRWFSTGSEAVRFALMVRDIPIVTEGR